MSSKQNLFYAIKLLSLMIILAELSVLKSAFSPDSFHEYIQVFKNAEMYIQHIFLSIVFWGLGALIFLKQA